MSILSRIFKGRNDRDSYRPLYDRAVALGRDRSWYQEGKVPDTLDGRFDMIAAVLALVLLRLEREGPEGAEASVLVAELFIADMDGSVRQMGIGDLMVGKHVGKMMGALGGRLTAFREAIHAGSGFEAPVRRNIFHDSPPSQAEVEFVSSRLAQLHRTLEQKPLASLLAGEIPAP
ncbi:MAG TPA: ubiquinol-cytochrome C chaperone family protein [Allosphingosinicella sp.]|nr:ubiquinol-cytochrome C chaperone family protein [Allosphingosinicella sp.]